MLSVVFAAGVVNFAPLGSVIVHECLNTASPMPRSVTASSLYLFERLLSEHLTYNLVSCGTE